MTEGGYRSSLNQLRAAHWRLYQQETHVEYKKNAILGTSHGLITCTLRVRASPVRQIAHLRFRAARTLTRLYAELSMQRQPVFEATLTANFVLEKTDEFGDTTYSVFYGQSFGECEREFEDRHLAAGRAAQQGPGGRWPVVLTQVADVDQIPEIVTPDDVSHEYEKLFDESDVTVHSIINYVLIFRSFLPHHYRQAGSSRAHYLARAQKVSRVLRL